MTSRNQIIFKFVLFSNVRLFHAAAPFIKIFMYRQNMWTNFISSRFATASMEESSRYRDGEREEKERQQKKVFFL